MLTGHEGEISKITFNPQGSRILTASSDKTSRLWDVESGECLQVLEGHTDEIFSCAFNYEGMLLLVCVCVPINLYGVCCRRYHNHWLQG